MASNSENKKALLEFLFWFMAQMVPYALVLLFSRYATHHNHGFKDPFSGIYLLHFTARSIGNALVITLLNRLLQYLLRNVE